MVYFAHLAIAAALAPLGLAHPPAVIRDVRGICASEPPPGFLDTAAKLQTDNATLTSNFRAAVSSLTVTVQFHIVAPPTSPFKPNPPFVTDAQITNQFNVLKNAFASYGINFVYGGFDRTANTAWTTDTSGSELAMKKKLRKGDYKTLNLYIIQAPRLQSLGYCTFPQQVTTGSDAFFLDGCTIRYDTLPGGTQFNFNQGKTTIHETGHWFGLLHTFQGGSCTGAGDLISDTPQQLSATNGCPTGRDSCPNQPGLDPIHNYMDYSIDSCYTNFTPLQKARMFDMYALYRA